jgi:MurNAc alpha-1-phosphate uridylyltransferase
MWPQARTTPKTLLPVANHPFAWWQLDWLAKSGITSVVYCIGHLGEQVRDYVGNGSTWGLTVRYVDEGTQLRGTAGALRLAGEQGVLEDRFLVLYGDSWLRIDPAEVLRASESAGLPALMTVFDNGDRWDGSNAVYVNGLVARYEKGLVPQPPDMHWIDYGLLAFTRETIVARIPAGEVSDLSSLCTSLAEEGLLAGYEATERFYEIGSPQGLRDAEELLSSRGTS